MTPVVSAQDFLAILPELIVCGAGLLVLLFDLFGTGRGTNNLAGLSLIGLGAAAYADIWLLGRQWEGFGGTVSADDYSIAFELIFIAVTAFTVLIS